MRSEFSFPSSIHWVFYFVAAPCTSLAGLQSTETALPYADYKTEVLDSLLSIPTQMWAVEINDKLPYERQLSDYSMCLQLGYPNRNELSVPWSCHWGYCCYYCCYCYCCCCCCRWMSWWCWWGAALTTKWTTSSRRLQFPGWNFWPLTVWLIKFLVKN